LLNSFEFFLFSA